jgi:pyridinium-3,5-biscarboxylic acid mononucleotide synthase
MNSNERQILGQVPLWITRLDTNRRHRTGIPEVVFAEGKPVEHTLHLLEELRRCDASGPALATRCPDALLRAAPGHFADERVSVDEVARTVLVGTPPPTRGRVLIVTAGSTDIPVARECLVTLAALGVGAELLADVGVAGLDRLLGNLDVLRAAECLVVVAGMDGALPSVVSGLTRAPIVAVPSSVGYGVAAGGMAAAAAILASCSPGITVVNIDNGFGAAVHVAKIIDLAHGGYGELGTA